MNNKLQGRPALHLLALLTMFTGIGCVAFLLYMMPFIFLDFDYNVPEFVFRLGEWYRIHHDLAGTIVIVLTVLPIIVAGILLFVITRFVNIYLETHHEPGMPDLTAEEVEAHKNLRYSTTLGRLEESTGFHPWWLVFGIVLFVLALLLLSEYLVFIQFF